MLSIIHEVEEVELDELPWWMSFLGKMFQYPRWQATWMDYTVEIEFSASPYIPARTSGPPENCYPAEGGGLEEYQVSLIGACFYDDDGNEVMREEDLTDEEKSRIECNVETEIDMGGYLLNELIEHAADADQHGHEPEYDPVDAYERRMENW